MRIVKRQLKLNSPFPPPCKGYFHVTNKYFCISNRKTTAKLQWVTYRWIEWIAGLVKQRTLQLKLPFYDALAISQVSSCSPWRAHPKSRLEANLSACKGVQDGGWCRPLWGAVEKNGLKFGENKVKWKKVFSFASLQRAMVFQGVFAPNILRHWNCHWFQPYRRQHNESNLSDLYSRTRSRGKLENVIN